MVLVNLLSFELLKKKKKTHFTFLKSGIYLAGEKMERTERGVERVYWLLEAV